MSRLDSITDWKERAQHSRYHAGRLAAQLKVTPRHLRLYYSEIFGRSPQYLLDGLRLAEAARLLCEEAQPVGETARILHCSNVQVFCKQFKRLYGCTPSEFARKYARKRKELLAYLNNFLGSNELQMVMPPPPWKQIERALFSRLKTHFKSPNFKRRIAATDNK